jgi:hypothetical protein
MIPERNVTQMNVQELITKIKDRHEKRLELISQVYKQTLDSRDQSKAALDKANSELVHLDGRAAEIRSEMQTILQELGLESTPAPGAAPESVEAPAEVPSTPDESN